MMPLSFDDSMSSFRTYTECKKKYEYKYVRGLTPLVESTESMDMGTLYHAALAGIYECYGYHAALAGSYECYGADIFRPLTIADRAIDNVMLHGYSYHGNMRKLRLKQDHVELVRSMVAYYWDHVGQHDEFETIIGVEVPFDLTLAGHTVRNTFDLVVQENGRRVVYDHKTVGDIKQSLDFLPLDIQTNMYSVAAWRHFGEPVEFVHNYMRRKVPSELTATGRKSTMSQDPNDYVKRVRTYKTAKELTVIAHELQALSEEMQGRKWYPREPQKGFMGCNGCSYRDICSAEQTGHTIPPSILALTYDVVEETPTL